MAPEHNARFVGWWLPLLLTLALNLGAWLYSYGQLSARVAGLEEQVREVRALMWTHIQRP